MHFNETTKDFVKNLVLPKIYQEDINSSNLQDIIDFIEDEFEKPLSVKIASGEDVDFEFFTLVNNVISDLCINAK